MSRDTKAPRPTFFDDPAVDRVVAMLTALSVEVGVLREHIDAMEAIAVEKGVLTAGQIDERKLSPEEMKERAARYDGFIKRVFFVLFEDYENLKAAASSDDAEKSQRKS